jgi:hypothetical protein
VSGFIAGFLQSLLIYVTAVVLIFLAEHIFTSTAHWVVRPSTVISLIAVGCAIALAVWHGRQGRRAKVAGVVTGAIAWPVIFGALFIAYLVVAFQSYQF